MSNTMTKKGAAVFTTDLDKIASTVEAHWEAMGIPPHIAEDFSLRCDIISDLVDHKVAAEDETGLSVDHGEGGFDPNAIADDVGGPHQHEADEAFMQGEFSQQEKHELRDRQEAGTLPGADARSAALARLAAMARQGSSEELRSCADQLKTCAARLEVSKADGVGPIAKNLLAMAGHLDKAADACLKMDATGEGSPELIVSSDRMCQAVTEILPHVEGLEAAAEEADQSSPTALLEYERLIEEGSIAKLVSLAARLVADAAKDMGGASKEASKKEEDEKSEDEEEEKDAGKKASVTYDLFA